MANPGEVLLELIKYDLSEIFSYLDVSSQQMLNESMFFCLSLLLMSQVHEQQELLKEQFSVHHSQQHLQACFCTMIVEKQLSCSFTESDYLYFPEELHEVSLCTAIITVSECLNAYISLSFNLLFPASPLLKSSVGRVEYSLKKRTQAVHTFSQP